MFGKHRKKDTPNAGGGGPKPKKKDIFARFATGAIQVNHTRKLRGTNKRGPLDGDIK